MYVYKAIVVKIVDGDTIDLDIDLGMFCWLKDQRVRLKGIDTPEIRTQDLIEKSHGFMAKTYVELYCPVGSEVIIKTLLDKKSKFGRLLGEIYKNDENVNLDISLNDRLIFEHLAVPYHGQNRDDVKESHLKNRELLGI